MRKAAKTTHQPPPLQPLTLQPPQTTVQAHQLNLLLLYLISTPTSEARASK